jgi:hypothetical protein
MRFKPSDLFTVFIIAVMAGAIAVASQWELRASIIIVVLGSVGVVMATAQLIMDVCLRDKVSTVGAKPTMELPTVADTDPKANFYGTLEIWGWLLGLLVLINVIGLQFALPLFVVIYTRFYGATWRLGILLAAMIAAFIFGVYDNIMRVYWPEFLLEDIFESLGLVKLD